MRSLRRSLAILSLLLAWLCANGALLDVAQVFAWSRMFSGYAESLSVGDALRETFDPAKPCHICEAIARAKQSSEKHAPVAAEQAAAKIVLVCESSSEAMIAPRVETWPRVDLGPRDSWLRAVPVPPPRRVV